MWKIKNLKIENLWNEKDYDIEFNLHLNIIIGSNGIGKTTILRIINSALKIDSTYLKDLDFKSIKVLLVSEAQQKTLRIEREKDGIHFFLSNKAIYQEDELNKEVFFTNKNRKTHLNDLKVRQSIIKQVEFPQVKWLPTNRISDDDDFYDSDAYLNQKIIRDYENTGIINPIDYKLKKLVEKADEEISKVNQLTVKEDIEFRNNMVKRNFESLIDNSNEKNKASTQRFFETLEILKSEDKTNSTLRKLKDISIFLPAVKLNISGIDSIKDKLQKAQNDSDVKYTVDDVMKISAFSFLIQYIEDFDNYKEKIGVINSPMKNLEENFKNVFDDKFCIQTKNKCIFYKKNIDGDLDEFDINNFSSGEKQMLIFILECSLYLNKPCLYLTDEPEISLHLKWQKKYLDTLLQTNQENQFFVATHSPDIVDKYSDNIVELNKMVIENVRL